MPVKDVQSLIVAAETAEQAGKYKTALNKYWECRKLQEFDSEKLERIGDLADKIGDEYKALDLYFEANKKDARNKTALLKMAVIRNRLLNHGDALSLLRRVLETEPDNQAALKEKLITLKEMADFEGILETAEKLLALDAGSFEGHCYKGLAVINGERPNYELADFHLVKALSIDPSNPIAQFFSALLYIEKTQFDLALKLLDQSYEGFKAKKESRYMDEVSFLYCLYKDSASISKRKSRFDDLSIEKQIEIIQDCGIQITDLAQARSILDSKPAEDPFKDVIRTLCASNLIANGAHFDTECIGNPGDYARFAEMFRDIAQGDFPAENIVDDVCLEDEGGQAWLAFTLTGKEYKWKAQVNADWLDMNILRKMAALMPKIASAKRFILITKEEHSDFSLLCLSEKEIATLKDQTDLDFDLLGK